MRERTQGNDKIRVLLVITEELQYNRAPASRAWNISRELNRSGIETVLVGRQVERDRITGDNIIVVKPPGKGFLGNLACVVQTSARVLRVLQTTCTKQVIIRGYNLAPLAVILKLWRKKLIYDFHGYAYKEQIVEGRWLRAVSTRFFDWLALKLADHIIAIREELIEDLPKSFQRKTMLLPNGVDLEEFTVPENEEVLAKYNLPPHKKLVGFVGNWEAWLAFDDMLKSAQYFDDDTRLVVVGTGRGIDEYKSAYPGVRFTGQVPHQDAIALIKTMDVCLCPYSNEAIAKNKSYRKVLEYLAAGKPIVSSNASGREKFLKEGENDLVYEAGHPEDLARQVKRILSDEGLRSRMSLNNLELAKQFSWSEMIRNSGLITVLQNQRP